MVRLKVIRYMPSVNLTLFQFHMVRLKVPVPTVCYDDVKRISIPYGAIKSIVEAH